MTPILADVSVVVGLLAGLWIAFEVGFRIGRRIARQAGGGAGGEGAGGQISAIQGAILGLLGLLLAFCFAGAAGRFIERQDLIVEEANAIGTAYLRADLLDEPHRSNLRAALKGYTEHRIELSRNLRHGLSPTAAAEIERFHAQMWRAAATGVDGKPSSMVSVVTPINEVIDMHSTRVAAGRKHIPLMVLGLLVACSALAIGVIGYASGMSGHRRAPLTAALAILISMALWVTIDLDHPRAGLMRLSDEPLKALKFDRSP